MILLNAKDVFFYTPKDELNFFESIKSIYFVEKLEGNLNNIDIHIGDQLIEVDDFLYLYSIFKRYSICCRQLSKLERNINSEEISYVKNSEMLWYEDIWG